MGRWTDDGEGTVFLSPEKNIVLQSRSVAGHFTDNHNADCDTYEQRIAELERDLSICRESERMLEGEKDEAFRQLTTEQYTIQSLTAELARIKAESLRVVPTEKHELGHYEVAMAVFIGGATMIYERYDSDDGELVRLEHWEEQG